MSYTTVKLNISKGQKDKIRKALQDGESTITLRFDAQDLHGNDLIALTKTQINKINKAQLANKGATITMSKSQINHNAKVEGGFLGALLGMATRFLPTIAKTVLPALGVGALSGLASSGVQKAMGNGLYLKKGGCVCQVETDGRGLYLKTVPKNLLGTRGNGLYLKKESTINPVGSGLILGPNSPFKNIPILGAIL